MRVHSQRLVRSAETYLVDQLPTVSSKFMSCKRHGDHTCKHNISAPELTISLYSICSRWAAFKQSLSGKRSRPEERILRSFETMRKHGMGSHTDKSLSEHL